MYSEKFDYSKKLNTPIIYLFDYKSTVYNVKQQTDLKVLFSPFFSGIERNFNLIFNTNDITEDIICSEEFKTYYTYATTHYSVEEIRSLLQLLRSLRNLFTHYLVRAKKQKNAFVLQNENLLDDLVVFEGYALQKDGNITLHGMLSLMILFMTNDQISDLFTVISTLLHTEIAGFFFKGAKKADNANPALDMRIALVAKFKDTNNINSQTIPRKIHDNFFMSKFLIPNLSEFFLTFEKLCYRHWDIELRNLYSSFYEISDNIGLKRLISDSFIRCRNRWAHGEYFKNLDGSGETLAEDFIDLCYVLKSELQDCELLHKWLCRYIVDFQNSMLSFRYRRMVELLIKINKKDLYPIAKTEERIYKLSKMTFDFNLLDISHQQKLWELSDHATATFKYKQKIEGYPEFDVHYLNVHKYSYPNASYFEINGIRLLGCECLVAETDQLILPTVKAFDEHGQELEIHIGNLEWDAGFCKYYAHQ